MSYELKYHSLRKEVWRWYWRAWKKTLWRLHLLIAIVLGFVLSESRVSAVHITSWLECSSITFLVVIAISALVPQLLFKKEERKLEVNPEGWSTTIGRKSGTRGWGEISAIQESDDSIAIEGNNSNALIIPDRAFTSKSQKESFLCDVRQWHSESQG